MPIPQPFSVEWSPSTGPAATPSWAALGRVFILSTDRGRGSGMYDAYKPGTADLKIRNGNNAGAAVTVDYADWRRWTQIRVVADFGSGDEEVFTGHVTALDHDTTDLPESSTVAIRAVDAMGIWNRANLAYEQAVYDPGFLGFGSTAKDLADELDAASTSIGTPDVIGDARAPVTLPATFVDVGGATEARFSDNAFAALRKALDVEMGTVHIGADGALVVNGRYVIPDTYAADPDPVFELTDDLDAQPDGYPYVRRSLKFADAMSEWHNGATATGLRKRAFTVGTAGDTGFLDLVPFDDLWCANDNWVSANADHLAALYVGVERVWPTEVSVVVWNTAMDDFTLAEAVVAATSKLGRAYCRVYSTLPGEAQTSWDSTIEGVKFTVTESQAVATLKLGVGLMRWQAGYITDVTLPPILSLGTAGRGLGSGAILGP